MDIKIKGKHYNVSFIKKFVPCSIRTNIPNFTNTTNIAYQEGSKFLDKVVLVTGAYRGIGYSIAKAMYREGAKVIITGRNEAKLKEASVRFNKDRFQYLVWDVANTNQVDDMFDKAMSIFGGIDILVNNAGVNANREGLIVDFEQMKPDDWHFINTINVIGTKLICEKFVHIANHGSSVLNILSNTALRPALESYFMSKWAMYSYTKALSDECKEKGITVNGICPGPTKTDMMWKEGKTIVWNTKNKRLGLPEEIAELSVQVVVGGLKGLTGKIITCDGGETLMNI
jgi:NAD(P)-dependent dehydrogenase (short-subunit alcohol dehydrogenase family)